MTPQNKLRTATLLMWLALAPLTLGVSWALVALFSVEQFKGQMGISDAFLMIFVLLFTYTVAVAVAGGSAIWSTLIVRQYPQLRTKSATITKTIVGTVLVIPLLWFAGASLSLF